MSTLITDLHNISKKKKNRRTRFREKWQKVLKMGKKGQKIDKYIYIQKIKIDIKNRASS